MKRLIHFLFATLVLSFTGLGQIPQIVSHQGYIADSTGTGITGTLPMTFRMYDDSTAGSLILTQAFPSVSLTKGVFNANLDVSTVAFTGQYWLETEVNSQTLAPRTRLTSAPYSLSTLTVNIPGDATINGITIGRGGNNDNSNTALGRDALMNNVLGGNNTAIGVVALTNNINGSQNIAIGQEAMSNNVNGSNNVAIGGYQTLANGGNSNVAVGSVALQSSVGSDNTAVGYYSLYNNVNGSLNTALGAWSNVSADSNATAIGAYAYADTKNTLILGSINGVNGATADVNVGIGTTTPDTKLHVVGSVKMVDGNQGAGKVLTSDANGLANWQLAGSQIGFKANTNATQALTDVAFTTIQFPDEEYDDGDSYNPATHEFTAPSTGVYHFDANLVLGGAGGASYVQMFVDGVIKAGTLAHVAGVQASICISVNLKLNAGSVVNLKSFSLGGNTTVYTGSPSSNFSGYKIY